jgi:hypothetical protein
MTVKAPRRRRPVPPFHFNDWPAPRVRSRAGVRVLLDRCRKILVPATQEELVRQKFLTYLIDQLGVPEGALSTELHLKHTGANGRGRVDVVAWTGADMEAQPLFVAECKAPHVPLTDDCLDQVLRYEKAVGTAARVVALTNGHDTSWYRVERESVRMLAAAPRFSELLSSEDLPLAPSPAPTPRPPARTPSTRARRTLIDSGIIGEDSPSAHLDFLVNLAGLVHFDPEEPTFDAADRTWSIEEVGTRYTKFGNAGGGSWTGLYRYFLIEDARGQSQIVSISVMGRMATVNDPQFGNTTGHTILIVAIDDFDRKHNSLQLNLDTFADYGSDEVTIWHSGRLTAGNRGRAPDADVIAFVRKRAPHLATDDGRVLLGTLPRRRLLSWSDVRELVLNLIDYALVRDEFRSTLKIRRARR